MTLSEIKQTKAGQRPENAHVFEQQPATKKNNLPKLPKSDPEGMVFIKNHLLVMKVDFVTELQFAEHLINPKTGIPYRYRFDVAIIPLKVAIEYEGIYSEKSRHTTRKGYERDADKYSLAAILGWKVLRYTAGNYKNFINDLNQILK